MSIKWNLSFEPCSETALILAEPIVLPPWESWFLKFIFSNVLILGNPLLVPPPLPFCVGSLITWLPNDIPVPSFESKKVAVDFGNLILVGYERAALKPSTTAIPSLTFAIKCVFSESNSNLSLKGLTI